MITNYNEYIKLISEGLIRTHNIEKYIDSLVNVLKDNDIDVSYKLKTEQQYTITIINNITLDKDKYDLFIKLNNNFGYYPTKMWITNNINMVNFSTYDVKKLKNIYKEIKIEFEAKYDGASYENDIKIPDKLYHLSPQKHKEKILKNGLIPTSKNRKTYHTERIYLFDDINNFQPLLKSLKNSDRQQKIELIKNPSELKKIKDQKYFLLEINLNENTVIHNDPNFKDGFFVYDNITPDRLKLIKENL